MIRRGDIVGDYLITRKLGEGGMGEVWSAEKDGVNYAIKFCTKPDDDAQRRFEREYRLMKLIDSPYILKVFANGEMPDGTKYIVEELADCTVKELVEKGLSSNQKYELSLKICQGLIDIHAKGETHRDIKPNNILILNGIPKIADFGIGVFIDRDTDPITTTKEYYASSGYAAPEIVLDNGQFKEGSPLLDVYGLGSLLYYIFSEAADPYFFNYKQVSPEIYPILAKCREIDRSARYQSVKEVKFAIEGLMYAKEEAKTMQEWYKVIDNYAPEVWVENTLPILLRSQGIPELLDNFYIFSKRWKEIKKACLPHIDEIILYILKTFDENKQYWLQFEDAEVIARMAACLCFEAKDVMNSIKLLDLALNKTIATNRWAAMQILHNDVFKKFDEKTVIPYINFIQENTWQIKRNAEAIGVEIPPCVRRYLKITNDE